MLKVKEEERMSWEDIFNHPLVKNHNSNSTSSMQADGKVEYEAPKPANDLEASISLNQ